MPTILRSGPYRVYFYSHEPNEPPHKMIEIIGKWLELVLGFTGQQSMRI
jgi:hypothetical protein